MAKVTSITCRQNGGTILLAPVVAECYSTVVTCAIIVNGKCIVCYSEAEALRFPGHQINWVSE